MTDTTTYDVFISHARADKEWVRPLAKNLHNLGLEVFFDEWRMGPGDTLIHSLDQGLRAAKNGVLVVSPTAVSRPFVMVEYAYMMEQAIKGQKRLIPVLYKDAEMPPLLSTRLWVDFRDAEGDLYFKRLDELAKALKGVRSGPPPRMTTSSATSSSVPRIMPKTL